MCDPCFMHHSQPVEQLLDHHLCVTFIPPIVLLKSLPYIPYRDILHRNVHVVIVFIGGVELNKPLILSLRQRELLINRMRLVPVKKQGKFGQNLPLIIPVDS